MPVSILGGVLVVLAAAGLGGGYTDRLRRRESSLRRISAILCEMATKVECYRMPMCEIFASLTDEEAAVLLSEYGLYEGMRRCSLLEGAEERRVILELESAVGTTAEGTVLHLRQSEAEVQRLLGEYTSSLPDRIRMVRALSVLAGATAVILLV